jgi:hypothetical protein
MPKEIKHYKGRGMLFDYTEANRQGEMLFFKIVPGTLKTFYGKSLKVSSGVIREGEKEGHEHKITGKEVQLTMFPESTTSAPGETEDQPSAGIIDIKENGAKVTHPEHGSLPLKKGKHVVLTQKESAGKNKSASVKD